MRKTVMLLMILGMFYTPLAVTLVLRILFRKGVQKEPSSFSSKQKEVQVHKDIAYGEGFYDLYLPPKDKRKQSIIINIHGGAFVAGDKKDNVIYSTMLASHGYLVLVPNYRLSPSKKYPTQLSDIASAYHHFQKNYALLDELFPKQVLMGDSAGGLMAIQLALVHANKDYAKRLNLQSFLPNLSATVLFCAPFYLEDFLNQEGISAYIVEKIAQAYLGFDWQNPIILDTLHLERYLHKDLVPLFITDGSQNSFKDQAVQFVKTLKRKNLTVESLFFDEKSLSQHEYQMVMNTPEAFESFQKVLGFLEKYG